MLVRNFLNIFIFLFISLGFVSCESDKESRNESFTWDLKNNTVGVNTVEPFEATEYSVFKTELSHRIVGYINSTDSLVIVLGNLKDHELTIGDYKFGFSETTRLTYFENGVPNKAKSGVCSISYLNQRISFNFDAFLTDGHLIENGIAEDLIINVEGVTGQSDTTTTTTVEVGTIEAKIDGAFFEWDKSQCSGKLFANTLQIDGANTANSISLYFVGLTTNELIKDAVGKTFNIGDGTTNISYIVNGSAKFYFGNSGSVKFESYENNILTLSFNANMVNNTDATDEIPLVNGKVKALKIE